VQAAFSEGASVPEYTTAAARLAPEPLISSSGCSGRSRWNRHPGGMVTVPARPYIVIPAALRRRCGLRAGDYVLLAAMPGEDVLVAYSFTVVDKAMRAHAPIRREGRQP
jgi:AbrB family looped-hinge helix DNA binding protein